MPWKIAVNMAATNYKPVTTYAVRATQGLTVSDTSGWCDLEGHCSHTQHAAISHAVIPTFRGSVCRLRAPVSVNLDPASLLSLL
jgi:hypothetical protein